MSNPTNLPYDLLVDLAEGRLSAEESTRLRQTVAANPQAAAELAWLEQTLGLMRSDDSEDAPDHVINRALRLVRPPTPAPAAPGLLQRLLASLRFDSMNQPLAMGVRSGGATVRQLLYNADDRDIDLRIVPEGTLWRISGQILGPDESGEVLLHSSDVSVTAELNTLSEFNLPLVPAGAYNLTIRQGNCEIEIGDIFIRTETE
ncbi:MAG: hypothetical protein MUD01_13700 [Chloroflexaceae bacterium]|nr:hypothetical protein [Chloroflexaceae bacterium]